MPMFFRMVLKEILTTATFGGREGEKEWNA